MHPTKMLDDRFLDGLSSELRRACPLWPKAESHDWDEGAAPRAPVSVPAGLEQEEAPEPPVVGELVVEDWLPSFTYSSSEVDRPERPLVAQFFLLIGHNSSDEEHHEHRGPEASTPRPRC
jgi:hypothetical protein